MVIPLDVKLILVPYTAGDERHGSSEGPRRLLEAGAEQAIASEKVKVAVETVQRVGPFRDAETSSTSVNKELAKAVRKAVSAGQLPVVLAGSCVAAHGVLGGFEHSRCGVVWLDAHADFNTPDSTRTGFFPGMSMAVVAGHCNRDYWSRIGDSKPMPEGRIVMIGVRDLYPQAERERLERSAIHVVYWRARKPQGPVEVALNSLAEHVQEVYLHVDMDVLDPEIAPGVVDKPVPGGVSLEYVEGVIRMVTTLFRIRAVTLATFTPERDSNAKTLHAALRLIGLTGSYAGTHPRRP